MSESPVIEDPEIARPLEATLDAYRGLLPPEALAEMRALLEDTLGAHPVAALLRRRLGPASPPVETEEAVIGERGGPVKEPKRSAGGDD